MTDRRLTAAERRRTDPHAVFSDMRFEYESGVSSAERTAAAAHFQTRADEALRLAGLAAPPIRAGELMRDYRRRLLHQVQGHCDVDPKLRNVPASQIPREALPNFEKLIVSGAVERFKRPEGTLRSCTRRDHSGRAVTEFYGDEQQAWLPFTSAIADNGEVLGFKVGRINGDLFTGRNGPEARALRGQEAAALKAGYAVLEASRAGASASG